jgi:hypothetical protein
MLYSQFNTQKKYVTAVSKLALTNLLKEGVEKKLIFLFVTATTTSIH